MTIRVAISLLVCSLIGTIAASVLTGQTEGKTESVVLKAKEFSKKTGRPILAIAGSNT